MGRLFGDRKWSALWDCLGAFAVEVVVYIQKVSGNSIGLLNSLYLGLFCDRITTELRPILRGRKICD